MQARLERKAPPPEEQARLEEFMCDMSNEVFDGLSLASIWHVLASNGYWDSGLANYALSTKQQPPH